MKKLLLILIVCCSLNGFGQTFEIHKGDTINLTNNNLKQGLWLEVEKDIIISKISYKNNKRHGKSIFYYKYTPSQVQSEIRYVNGKKRDEKAWYENGNKRSERIEDNEGNCKTYRMWHSNGVLSYEFECGVGSLKKWHTNGNPCFERVGIDGVEKAWDEDGKQKRVNIGKPTLCD